MTLAELGQSLKEAREARGLSLDDVAERIKVSVRILRLIEEGEQQGLPHAVYSRGFIISFASLLDYDKNLLKGHLDALFPAEDLDEVQSVPLPIRRGRSISGSIKRILVLALVLAVLGGIGYGCLYVYEKYGDTIVNLVKKPFSAISDPIPSGGTAVASAESAPADRTNTAMAAQGGEAVSGNSGQSEGINLSGTASAASQEASSASAVSTVGQTPENGGVVAPDSGTQTASAPPEEQDTPFNQTGHELVIHADARCWVSYYVDSKRTQVFTMEPGTNHTINYDTSLELRLGNPSGVSLTVNGKPYEGSLRSNRALTLQFP